jgi:3-(3-hydroxy-phenyl)propionate hydroxylase
VHATREYIAHGAKNTEFMAPPDFGFKLMREAALRLAGEDERVRALINPRQSTPISYVGSPLNLAAQETGFERGARAGDTAPDASLQSAAGVHHLSQHFGRGFVALLFSEQASLPATLTALGQAPLRGPASMAVLRITRNGHADAQTLVDRQGVAAERYDAREGSLYVVRPDGYVLGRWREPDWSEVRAALAPYRAHSVANGASR